MKIAYGTTVSSTADSFISLLTDHLTDHLAVHSIDRVIDYVADHFAAQLVVRFAKFSMGKTVVTSLLNTYCVHFDKTVAAKLYGVAAYSK